MSSSDRWTLCRRRCCGGAPGEGRSHASRSYISEHIKQVNLNKIVIGTCQPSVWIAYLHVIVDVDDDGVGERLDDVQHLQTLDLFIQDEGEEAIVEMVCIPRPDAPLVCPPPPWQPDAHLVTLFSHSDSQLQEHEVTARLLRCASDPQPLPKRSAPLPSRALEAQASLQEVAMPPHWELNSFITSRQRPQPLPLLRPLLLLYTLGARGGQVQPHNRGHRRSGIPASRSITTPRFSALCNLAKAPSAVRLRVRCDLAVIPVLSFSEERVGEVSLDLKSAPSETARAVIHRGLVTEQQNQRRGTASILTTADLGYSTALQGATIRSQPLFFSSLRSCSRISISSTKQSILSSVFINTKLEVFGY
ncbi:hypothetical protein BHM03_00051829 [Ensete ventricosum]|nr:hypothetical protein BHM03_00051829 [Ensete ventricosum]